MKLERLLQDAQTAAVLCLQLGDTSKGKIVDLLAETWADEIYRGTGGNNAGHTVVINGKKHIFHLIPSGILHDARGVVNVLGNGMVINLEVLLKEMAALRQERHTYNHLRISRDAHVILPWHIALDQAENKSQAKGGIGSTGRGVGPCYEDKIGRRGVTIGDLYSKETLVNKLELLRARYQKLQELQSPTTHPLPSIDEVMHNLQLYAAEIQPLVHNTVAEIQESLRAGRKILLEGAQGLLLSIEHGTGRYATSSDCSLNGTASGVGLSASDIDISFGLMKFPFMSRVGAGPFPTELGGERSEEYCAPATCTMKTELETHQIPFTEVGKKIDYDPTDPKIRALMNSEDPFLQGVGIRLAGGEFGSTTGRPRRMGWTDLVSGKYAANINRSTILVLAKADCLAGAKEFKICTGYDRAGAPIGFTRDCATLTQVQPVYQTYEGYGDIQDVRSFEKLPRRLQEASEDVERYMGIPVGIIGVGPERKQTIIKN